MGYDDHFFCIFAQNVGPNNLAFDWDIIMQFCISVAGNY